MRSSRPSTDNPVVMGTVESPRAFPKPMPSGASLGLCADALGVALAELAAMSERRIDRLVNPLVSGLPAFLAADSGAGSGFMIAQYTAASLTGENRRHAAPASLDGGVTSGLQEDHLAHATPAAVKLLKILGNAETHLRDRAVGRRAGLRLCAALARHGPPAPTPCTAECASSSPTTVTTDRSRRTSSAPAACCAAKRPEDIEL